MEASIYKANLMYVLQSYGQLVKTVFICKYLLNKSMRKKINSQLNKGKQLEILMFGAMMLKNGIA